MQKSGFGRSRDANARLADLRDEMGATIELGGNVWPGTIEAGFVCDSGVCPSVKPGWGSRDAGVCGGRGGIAVITVLQVGPSAVVILTSAAWVLWAGLGRN